MDLSEFEVDTKLYEDGKKIPFGEGCYIKVRAAGSERAQKVRERLWKPYAAFKEVNPEILARINAQWLAQGLLTEFVGFTVGGKPFDVDLSKEEDQKRLGDLLKEARYKAFRNKVLGFALEEANFQSTIDEVLEKNSVTSPAGSSSGADEAKK